MLTEVVMALTLTAAQPTASEEATRVQAELQALRDELNRARRARDRSALERVFAPEFRWAHGAGYVDDRARHIDGILEANSERDLPRVSFAPPAELILLGDVAIIRRPNVETAAGMRLYTIEAFVRRGGRWQILHAQGTPQLPERRWIVLSPAALDAFAGRYRNSASGTVTLLTRAGDALRALVPDRPHRTLRPVAETQFFDDIGGEYRFERTADGRVAAFTYRNRAGRESRLERTE